MIDIPQMRRGQIVRVFQKITEGKRERIVPLERKLIKVRGNGVNQAITLRQSLEGVEVDKIFPTAMPMLTKIEVVEQVKSLVKGEIVSHGKPRKKAKKTSKKRFKK